MMIRRVRLAPFRLVLREPLETATGIFTAREGVLVVLEALPGIAGIGEATPLPEFGTETIAEAREALIALAPGLVGESLENLEEALEGLELAAASAPAARAAVDVALHDLAARASGRSLASWLAGRFGRSPRQRVAVNALLGGREPERLAEQAQRAVSQGYRTLKVKVGAASLAHETARLAALRSAVGPRPKLRLDANGAWGEAEAIAHLARLAAFDVELVEQPVAADDIESLARVRAASPIHVAADEAAAGVERAERVIALRAADVICVKLAAVGGLRPALRIAGRARRAGLDVIVTSGLDGAVARTAALHLAASLPGVVPACGLATAELLEADLATTEAVKDGYLELPPGPGLGVALSPVSLAQVASGPEIEFGEGGR